MPPPMTEPIPFIDLKAQYAAMKADIDARIQRVLDHGQYILGPEVAQLEAELAAFCGASHAITVASGTEALLISLMALGVGPGDEVVTSPFTFAATAEVTALIGAVPVFVDVEPDTGNIDARLVEAAITPRTRAIMPVSLYGQPADMEPINEIAARHGIAVVEDGAQSFGASYRVMMSGAASTLGCTSFFPSKPLGGYGDGGAIFTSDDELARLCREIRVHGQERRYHHVRLGVGGRMDTIQCAVVLGKLQQFRWELAARQAAAERYLGAFAGKQAITVPVVRADRSSTWAQFTIQVERREAVAASLKAEGIPTAVHYPVPLHRQPAFADLSRVSGSLEAAERLAGRVLSLPLHPYISADTQARIADAVLRAATA